MSNAHLNQLERDVEGARERFATDLARLRSPATLSDFKKELWAEALQQKDQVVEKTKDAAKEAAQHLLSDIRDRAAANPAAALAVGAGLAWHLLRKPPITTLLVGAGLVSLMRTSPAPNGDFASGLMSQANSVAGSVQDRVHEWGTEAAEVARQTASQLADNVAQATDVATSAAHRASDMISDAMPEKDMRDQLLLGAAALAIAAAVGIASQRRS
jgi:gas vesicle protein